MTDRETQDRITELTKRLDTLSLQQERINKEIKRTKEAVTELTFIIQGTEDPKESF